MKSSLLIFKMKQRNLKEKCQWKSPLLQEKNSNDNKKIDIQ